MLLRTSSLRLVGAAALFAAAAGFLTACEPASSDSGLLQPASSTASAT